MYFASLFPLLLWHVTASAEETIELPQGTIRGGVNGTTRYFRGIPYATPPLGDLRWRPPVKHPGWPGVLPTIEFGATCLQYPDAWNTIVSSDSSEDCLFVNVYAPRVNSSNLEKKYPVMVYIHAGEYRFGSSNDKENNWPYFSDQVVLVTFNFRLGVLGYLASDALRLRSPDNSTGNYGQQDQRLALKWVKDNIEFFQGDTNNVLIFGESSGGTNVAAHITNPRSHGLFDKAILESPGIYQIKTYQHAVANHDYILSALAAAKSESCGFLQGQFHSYSGFTLFGKNEKPTIMFGTNVDEAKARCAKIGCSSFVINNRTRITQLYEGFAQIFDLTTYNPPEAAFFTSYVQAGDPKTASECLIQSKAPLLINITGMLPHDDTFDTDGFAPVLDGVDLVEPIARSIERGQFAKGVPVLAGTNLDEGTEFMGVTPPIICNATQQDFKAWSVAQFGSQFTPLIVAQYTKLKQPIPVCVEHHHQGKPAKPVTNPVWEAAAMRAATDYGLTCPVRKLSRNLVNASHTVYTYVFTHTPTYTANFPNTSYMGAFHGAEVPFVFGDQFELRGDEERAISKQMGCYWVNFATTGDPNGSCDGQPLPQWSAFTEETAMMIRFDVGELQQVQRWNWERCDVFDRLRSSRELVT